MRGQSGIDDLLDVRRPLEGPRHLQRVRPMGLHPQMQRLRSALCEPRVVRARYCADSVLQEAEGRRELGVVRGEDEGTHDDVRVAVDVFSETVEDDIGALEEGGGVEGGEEGVVDEDVGVGGV